MRSLGPRSIFPQRRPVHSSVFEAPGGSAPAAEQLARTRPGKDGASGALTPQASAGEGRREPHAARGRRGHVVGSCTGDAPGVHPRPFVCPPRRSPLPKERWHRGKSEARRWRGGGRRGREHRGGWERLQGWRAGGRAGRSGRSCPRRRGGKSGGRTPILPPTPECLLLPTERCCLRKR